MARYENTIEGALLALSDQDTDHARIQNGVGFNGRDTEFGNSLGAQIRAGRILSSKQLSAAYKMLRTYKVQLAAYGVNYEDIASPLPPGASPSPRGGPDPTSGTITVVGKVAEIVLTNWSVEFKDDRIKSLPGRKWDSNKKAWIVPIDGFSIPLIKALCPPLSIVNAQDLDGLAKLAEANTEGSRATDADILIPGLGGELMPFQRAGVKYAIENGSVLIGDEMGLGKTVQALAALEAEGSYPALVVVPAVVKLNWERETRKWLPHRTVEILSGKSAESDILADVVVINYDILDAWTERLAQVHFKAVIADESHYVKNPKAKRTRALKRLTKTIPLRILLTGTPIMNRPVELIPQLDMLGLLSHFGGYWGFAKRYCDAYQTSFGWDLSGASNLNELHAKLRQVGYVRRTKDQVLKELPAKRRVSVPMEMTDPEHYRQVEDDLRVWIREQIAKDEEFMASLVGLDPDEMLDAIRDAAHIKAQRIANAEMLVRIEALKQTAVEEKLRSVRLWITDFLESGKKLVVFAHHKFVVHELATHFGADFITGEVSANARQERIDRFQNDPEAKLLVLNIQAGGVGITLTAASDVAFVELPWRPGDLDQAEDRCHRIGQDDSVTAWYLLAADTIEEKLAAMIDDKRVVVTAATDGKAVRGGGILGDLIEALVGTKEMSN